MHRRPNFSSYLKLVNSFGHFKCQISGFCELGVCVLHGFASQLKVITVLFKYYFKKKFHKLGTKKSWLICKILK